MVNTVGSSESKYWNKKINLFLYSAIIVDLICPYIIKTMRYKIGLS